MARDDSPIPRHNPTAERHAAATLEAFKVALSDPEVWACWERSTQLARAMFSHPFDLSELTHRETGVFLQSLTPGFQPSFEYLVEVVRRRSPALDHTFGPELYQRLAGVFAPCLAYALRGIRVELTEEEAFRILAPYRLLPDNPIPLAPADVAELQRPFLSGEAKPRHVAQWRRYRGTLRENAGKRAGPNSPGAYMRQAPHIVQARARGLSWDKIAALEGISRHKAIDWARQWESGIRF